MPYVDLTLRERAGERRAFKGN